MVTNAHVVWPFETVRVTFPDGSEHLDVPVIGWDLMADLAVIGPIETARSGLPLEDGEGLGVGSEVYLIGYPDEVDRFPQPSLTRGVISRFRQWEPIDLTFIQSGAAISGGQSGGVMVSRNGDVIAISGLGFGQEQDFALAASAADLLPRVEGLIAGKDVDGLGDRRLPASDAAGKREFTLTGYWDSKVAVLREPVGSEIEIRLESVNDSAVVVTDIFGDVVLEIDDWVTGIESGSMTFEYPGPHFVFFQQYSVESGRFAIQMDRDLIFIEDRDDHRAVEVGETVLASTDSPFDIDYFLTRAGLELAEDESVLITVDSVAINPFVLVARPNGAEAEIVDDDSGGGVFGLDAAITYTAPDSGNYIILIQDTGFREVGGYFLTIETAPPRAVTVPRTQIPESTPVSSPYGLMATYCNAEFAFSIQYPADWEEVVPDADQTAEFVSDQGDRLLITIEDLAASELGELTLDEYVDLFKSRVESEEMGILVISNSRFGEIGGEPAQLAVITDPGGVARFARLMFVLDRQVAYNATYAASAAQFEELIPIMEYSFGTIAVQGKPLANAPAFPSPDAESRIVKPPGIPDLAAMALTLADFPNGATLRSEGYDEAFLSLARYSRDFDSASLVIGSTRIIALKSEIELYPSAVEAQLLLELMGTIVDAETVGEVFAGLLDSEGIDPDSIEIETTDLAIGDGGRAILIHGESAAGDRTFALYAFAVDRILGSLIVLSPRNEFVLGDVVPLAGLMARRIADVLDSSAAEPAATPTA